MHQSKGIRLFLLVSLFCLNGSRALATPLDEVVSALSRYATADEFTLKDRVFEGRWVKRACQAKLRGEIDKVDPELVSETEINVTAVLKNITGRVQGNYIPWWLGVGIAQAHVNGKLLFSELENGEIEVKVRITESKIYGLDVGRFVSSSTANYAALVVNEALKRVWASKLGDWIGDWASKELKKKFPMRVVVE